LFLSAPPLWKQILRQNFVDPHKLADFLELTESQRQQMLGQPRFTLNLPQRLAAKIAKGTLEDPLLRQFLPTTAEKIVNEHFINDPVGDRLCRKEQKLLHKYEGRVLLVCTSACAMHCRFCFRQHFDYEVSNKIFDQELKLVASDFSINEVILSGGDPLSLDDRILEDLFFRLAQIPHIRKLRFHTRFPIGIPERLDDAFLRLLSKISLQFWFIIHANHPRELDEEVLKALKTVQRLGIPVLNQFVLLRGINDSVEVLYELCNKLVDHGIFPYYMHQLDRVQGAAHFEVPENEGKRLMEVLAAKLPGYAVPRYVKEVPGFPGKSFIM
jgi:EF-P beta-lysylation protein EpmB